MKLGRNDPCPCGSGQKYKRCCMDNTAKQQAQVFDDIEQTLAMNPNLNLDELNLVIGQRVHEGNNKGQADFCGLSSTQMNNWLYAPFDQLDWLTISTPDDVSRCPVMCYLTLILDEAMAQGGAFKSTIKGNLPVKIVKQASHLQPQFAVAEYVQHISINEYMGTAEDKFNALHYARILAEVAGIIYHRSGRFHVKKAAQKRYQTHGIRAFYLPMLEAAISKYNWGYFDGFNTTGVDLQMFWLFMLWRLQSHGSVDRLLDEVVTAFPALLHQLPESQTFPPIELLRIIIESRFINHFLQFWGFVTVDPKRFLDRKVLPMNANIQPLLTQTFKFNLSSA